MPVPDVYAIYMLQYNCMYNKHIRGDDGTIMVAEYAVYVGPVCVLLLLSRLRLRRAREKLSQLLAFFG